MNLSKKIIKLAKDTDTSLDGLIYIGDYYIDRLGWSEKDANKYIEELFANGTIEEIKALARKEGK